MSRTCLIKLENPRPGFLSTAREVHLERNYSQVSARRLLPSLMHARYAELLPNGLGERESTNFTALSFLRAEKNLLIYLPRRRCLLHFHNHRKSRFARNRVACKFSNSSIDRAIPRRDHEFFIIIDGDMTRRQIVDGNRVTSVKRCRRRGWTDN